MGLQRKMKRASGLFAAAALGTTLLAGSGPAARADDTTSSQTQDTNALLNTPLKVELNDTSLPTAVNLIRKKTGLNIVFMGSPDQFNRVSVSLNGKTVIEALNLIALSAGADVWEKDSVYFIGPKGSGPKPPVENTAQLLPDAAQRPNVPLVREKIFLMHSEPQELLYRLGVKTGPFADVNQQLTMSIVRSMLDSYKSPYSKMSSDTPVFNNINNGITPFAPPAVPTGQSNNGNRGDGLQNLGGNVGNSGNNSGNVNGAGSSAGSADQGAQRDNGLRDEYNRGGQGIGGGRGGGGGFQGGGGGFQGGGIPGQGGLGGGQGGAGAGAARSLLPDGIIDIFGYETDNSIIVRGTPDAIRDLKEIIGFFDVPPKQVMVQANFVTVSQTDTNAFGINWSFQKVNLQGGVNTGFSTQNTAFLTFATGNLQAQLSWILTTNHGKLVSAPTVTTFNNLPIQLQVGEQIPVFISNPVVSQNGTVVLATTIIAIPVVTQIVVTPRINADNSITLTGTLTVQDTRANVTGPQGQTAPIVTNQNVIVQRRIRNGETMVIGGLVRKNDQVGSNKVPLLGDLPLIGNLFKSRNVSTSDSELLVFITPSIIPEHNETSSVRGGGAAGLLNQGGGPGGGGGGAMP